LTELKESEEYHVSKIGELYKNLDEPHHLINTRGTVPIIGMV